MRPSVCRSQGAEPGALGSEGFVIPALGKLWGWEGAGGVCGTVAPSGTHHWAAGSMMRGILRAACWGFVSALGTENPSRISRGSREAHGEDVGFKRAADQGTSDHRRTGAERSRYGDKWAEGGVLGVDIESSPPRWGPDAAGLVLWLLTVLGG